MCECCGGDCKICNSRVESFGVMSCDDIGVGKHLSDVAEDEKTRLIVQCLLCLGRAQEVVRRSLCSDLFEYEMSDKISDHVDEIHRNLCDLKDILEGEF